MGGSLDRKAGKRKAAARDDDGMPGII